MDSPKEQRIAVKSATETFAMLYTSYGNIVMKHMNRPRIRRMILYLTCEQIISNSA